MDVRIGVTHSPRELSVELPDDTDRDGLKARVAEVMGDDDQVLWLLDRKGREVAVPGARIAYVEIGAAEGERRMGFGG